MDIWLRDLINRKLNVLSFSIAIAGFLAIAGVILITMGIKDEGTIDLTTPFLSGKAKSGFVGVLLLLCSVFISLGALHYRAKENSEKDSSSTQTIEIRIGDKEIKWTGKLTHWNDSHHLRELLKEIGEQLNDNQSEQRASHNYGKPPRES